MAGIEVPLETLTGSTSKSDDHAKDLYKRILLAWGMSEGIIEEGRTGVNLSARVRAHGEDYAKHLEETYGTKSPFLTATRAGTEYEAGKMGEKSIKSVDNMVGKNVVDAGTVQDAAPIAVDPIVIDVQRTRAPILDLVDVQAQPGFKAVFNIINDRSPPIGYGPENEFIDLSDLPYGDFSMETDEEDMRLYVDQINVSDFTQRAMDSLDYMDVMNTTVGQRITAWALTKAAAYFYADPTAGLTDFGYDSLGGEHVYPGMTRLAEDAGNDIDRTTVDASADGQPLLEDLKAQLTAKVEDTGLTYADARIAVSPTFFDNLENEGNPVTRLDTFSTGINFGARQLSIKGTPVTECPNILPNFELPWAESPEDAGNVFIFDRRATQFRALAPLFTLPLGRVGLADRAAMAEYGALIDKSHGEHLSWLQYDVPEASA